MKCTTCGGEIGAAAYTIDLLVGDDHCTVNLHQRCLRELVGNHATNQLNDLVLRVGWHQLELPVDQRKRA